MFWNYNFAGFLSTGLVCAIFYGLTEKVRSGIMPIHLVLDLFAVCVFTITFVISLILYLIFKDTKEVLFKVLHTLSSVGGYWFCSGSLHLITSPVPHLTYHVTHPAFHKKYLKKYRSY